jgi:hypothetical protein
MSGNVDRPYLNLTVEVDNKVCYYDRDAQIGDLVQVLEEIFGEDWPEVELRRSPIPGITWTTTIAN